MDPAQKTAIERELDAYKIHLESLEADVTTRTKHLAGLTDEEAKRLHAEGLAEATRRRDEMQALVDKQTAAINAAKKPVNPKQKDS